MGCAALMGSWGDGPGGQWSGGEMQGAGGCRRRPEAGAPGSLARSWQGRCPGARCLRCGPRTSARSPCGSGRCAPPGRREGVSTCRALPGATYQSLAYVEQCYLNLTPCTKGSGSECVSRLYRSHTAQCQAGKKHWAGISHPCHDWVLPCLRPGLSGHHCIKKQTL